MDIALDWNGQLLAGDIALDGAELATDAGLKTAIVVSLFSDARAGADDEIPAGETDPRGWWGDLLAPRDGDRTGSRLWLLARGKLTTETARRAEEYAREALQWLIDDKIAAAVDVSAEWAPPPPRGRLCLDIAVHRSPGDTVKHRFNGVWGAV